jgi:hypothetical protein
VYRYTVERTMLDAKLDKKSIDEEGPLYIKLNAAGP